MRALICIVFLTIAAVALANTCPPAVPGQPRSYRPLGAPANPHPLTDSKCYPYERDSSASNTPLCFQCHPHKYTGRIG